VRSADGSNPDLQVGNIHGERRPLGVLRERVEHRRRLEVPRRGDFKVVLAGDARMLIAFGRMLAGQEIVAYPIRLPKMPRLRPANSDWTNANGG